MLSSRAYKILQVVAWLAEHACVSPLNFNSTTRFYQIISSHKRIRKVKAVFIGRILSLLAMFVMMRKLKHEKKMDQYHLVRAFFFSSILLAIFSSILNVCTEDFCLGYNRMLGFLRIFHGNFLKHFKKISYKLFPKSNFLKLF